MINFDGQTIVVFVVNSLTTFESDVAELVSKGYTVIGSSTFRVG